MPSTRKLSYSQTPSIEIFNDLLTSAGIRLLIKREDLNHPRVSGNKWWKLKYNLADMQDRGKNHILTFGGAFSNHIYALAAAAQELELESTGIIRGEEVTPLNPTLQFASGAGMKLHYVSREQYRNKLDAEFIIGLEKKFGDFYLIPEGGSNELAVLGVSEFASQLDLNFDYICCPVGTGGTLAGIIRGLRGAKRVVGFSALKNGEFLNEEVRRFEKFYQNWEIRTEYDHGGYAKSTPTLQEFIDDFRIRHHIPLEFTYTGKMMWGIYDLAKKGYFDRGSTVLALHTGGIH